MTFNYDTYHAFQYDGDYYLFDNERLFSCLINKNIYLALTNDDENYLNDKEKEMFNLFHSENIFLVENPKTRYAIPIYDMVIVSMAVFHGCNLKCKYCFAEAGDNYQGTQRGFTREIINSAIDFLLTNSFFSKFNYYRINLVSGGEPLVDSKMFKTFISTLFERFEKSEKHLYVWFSTNGTLLTEDILKFIAKYNVGYGISIDGCKKANDALRVYPNGNGTYDKIVANIKMVQKTESIPQRLKELWGLMVYTQKNCDLIENIDCMKKMGFSTVQMRFVRSNDQTLLIDKDYINYILNFVKKVFTDAIGGDDSTLRLICNDSDYVGKIIKRVIMQTPCMVRCSAGSYMFSFAADGNIYPCDSFVGNSSYIIGNFHSDIDRDKLEKYRDISVHIREKCRTCWAKFVCGGDCYHNSFLKHGDILTPDSSYCEIMIPTIECIIAYSNQYRIKNRDGYAAFLSFLSIRERMSRK